MSPTRDFILKRIDNEDPEWVFGPHDFAPIACPKTVGKALQRMVESGELRRIDRGLYDRPTISALTNQSTAPDYRRVIDAIARRDELRLLVDGITAANDLGLTDAVPAGVTIYTDTRRRPVQVGKLVIQFKMAEPSRMYWAGRPAMRVVQALHWLKDILPADSDRVRKQLARLLTDQTHGMSIRKDLCGGFGMLPIWMQTFLCTVPAFELAGDT